MSIPCPNKRVKPHQKGYSVYTGLRSREQGKESLFICTWKRLQEFTLLISASLKRCPSVASQALARHQTLTYIKIDNREKNKRKQREKKIFTKMKILWIYCIIVKSLSIDFRKREREREKRRTSISLEWTERTLPVVTY